LTKESPIYFQSNVAYLHSQAASHQKHKWNEHKSII